MPEDAATKAQWARGTGGAFVIRSASIMLAYGVQVLVARLLGPENFGEYIFAMAALNVLAAVGSVGLHQSTVRFLPKYIATQQWGPLAGFLRWSGLAALICSTLLGALLAGVVALSRGWIEEDLRQGLLMAAAMCPFFVFFALQLARLQGLKRVWMSSLWEGVLRSLLFVTLLAAGIGFLKLAPTSFWTLGAFLVATIISSAFVSCFLWASLRRGSERAAPEYRQREWFRSSFLFLLLVLFSVLMMRTPVLILGALKDTVETGIFGATTAISGLVAFALIASNSMLSPMISQLHAQGRKEELQRVVTRAARWITLATFVLFVGVAIGGRFALSLFDPIFTKGYPAMVVLAAGQFLNAVCGPVGILLAMTGYVRQLVTVLGITAVINVILCAVLIPPLGLMGGALAASGTTVLWNGVLLWLSIRRLGIIPLPFLGLKRDTDDLTS